MTRVAFLCLLVLSGCRGLPFPEPALSDPYGQALKAETRITSVYQGLETRIFTRLVRLSPGLVAAQCHELSEARAESPAQAAERLSKTLAENAAPTFFAVVHTPEARWNDWELPNSAWHIALLQGEQQTAPERVTRLDRPYSPELKRLYPYLDDFAVLYRIRFPPGAQGEALRVSGVLGHMSFDWGAPP